MCGIAGWSRIHGDAAPDGKSLEKMVRLMRHRGPDDEGVFIAPDVGLGMRRLSIIDLDTGHQPIANENGTIHVVFNGEIYNFRQLRTELEEKGHRFATRSDTEVLVHGYEEWGDDLPSRLRGMFAFAIWDGPQRRLFLARDHFGIKPLYYTHTGGSLAFASEIKSLLAHSDVSQDIDLCALDQYLSYLYIPEPATIFQSVKALPPAHCLECRDGQVRTWPFWTFAPRPLLSLDRMQLLEQIREVFEDSVRSMLVADVPLGLFLSGGLDSTSILAMMARHANGPVRTFSIGFGERESRWDELEAAASVAKHFGTDHHEFRVVPDIVAGLPAMARHFDQPFANPTAVILNLLSRETRAHVKVALAGTGGDEMFAGYPRYLAMRHFQRYRMAPALLRRMAGKVAGRVIRDASDGRLSRQRLRRFLQSGAGNFPECYSRLLAAVEPERKRGLYTPKLLEATSGIESDAFLKAFLEGEETPELERLMVTDLTTYLPFNQLTYGDRMSMAQSLEVRVPFVDQRVVEVAGSIPLNRKIEGGITKGLFREAMAPFLPKEILQAPKLGLNLPIALWFRGDLKVWLREVLSRERLERRGYFRPEAVRTIMNEHEAGRRDHSLFLWALAVLEIWHQEYVDRAA